MKAQRVLILRLVRFWLIRLVRGTCLSLVVLLAAASQASDAGTYPVTCLGAPNAANAILFLQGIVPLDGLPAKEDFKPLWTRLAAELDLRIAVPSSTDRCQRSKQGYCWGMDSKASVEATYKKLIQTASACFPPDKGFGVVGFSNGGYHIARVVMRCLQPQPRWALAVGSAGDIRAAETRDLSACAPLHLLIGRRDLAYEKASAFARQLMAKRNKATFTSFAGGHTLPEAELRAFLKDRPVQRDKLLK